MASTPDIPEESKPPCSPTSRERNPCTRSPSQNDTFISVSPWNEVKMRLVEPIVAQASSTTAALAWTYTSS